MVGACRDTFLTPVQSSSESKHELRIVDSIIVSSQYLVYEFFVRLLLGLHYLSLGFVVVKANKKKVMSITTTPLRSRCK
jgi:hypothetical protein